MWEPVALCCFTRRTGSLILGSLEVVAAVIVLVFTVVAFGYMDFIVRGICHVTGPQDPDADNCLNVVDPTFRVTFGGVIIVCLIQLVCASMMIHGVRKSNHCLMIPYLIKNTIIIALNIAFISIFSIFLCVANIFVVIPVAYAYGSVIFMWTYFLLTVRAHYYEVKRGKVEHFHQLDERVE